MKEQKKKHLTLFDRKQNSVQTEHIKFEKLEMSEYLIENRNTNISKIFYSIKARDSRHKLLEPMEVQQ